MANPDITKMLEKAKSDASKLSKAVKDSSALAVRKTEKAADELIQAAKKSVAKIPHAVPATAKPVKKGAPRVKLDDALRRAADQYNSAYTLLNDNGMALYVERCRAVDMIVHIEGLVSQTRLG